jgi:signal transduction histidine kinase
LWLLAMKERALMLNGNFEIDSKEGTTVIDSIK